MSFRITTGDEEMKYVAVVLLGAAIIVLAALCVILCMDIMS